MADILRSNISCQSNIWHFQVRCTQQSICLSQTGEIEGFLEAIKQSINNYDIFILSYENVQLYVKKQKGILVESSYICM